MRGLDDGPMTIQNITNALNAAGVDGVTRQNIVAESGRIFGVNARSSRGISRQEEDAILTTGARRDLQRLLEEQGAFRTGLMEATRDVGSIGGLRAISQLVRDPEKAKRFSSLFNTLAGGEGRNIDLTSGVLRSVMGMDKTGMLDKNLMGDMSKEEMMGLTRVFQAMSGQLDGKEISAEAQQTAYDILQNEDAYGSVEERRAAAVKFLRDYDSDTMDKYEHGKMTKEIYEEVYGESFHKKIEGKRTCRRICRGFPTYQRSI
jgi:hypothetical protein